MRGAPAGGEVGGSGLGHHDDVCAYDVEPSEEVGYGDGVGTTKHGGVGG